MDSKSQMVYTKITVTMPDASLKKLKELCKLEHRSKSNCLVHCLEKYYDLRKVTDKMICDKIKEGKFDLSK